MSGGEESSQKIDSGNSNNAENMFVGRDFKQVNRTNQISSSETVKFPVENPEDNEVWADLFSSLLSILPLELDVTDKVFRVAHLASWVIGIGTIGSILQESITIAINIPYDTWLFAIALFIGIILDTRIRQ